MGLTARAISRVAQPGIGIIGGSGSRFLPVAGAGEDGQARVFREGGIGLGELAAEKLGAFAGFDKAGVEAMGAKTEPQVGFGG
jgi:hypothetical protein